MDDLSYSHASPIDHPCLALHYDLEGPIYGIHCPFTRQLHMHESPNTYNLYAHPGLFPIHTPAPAYEKEPPYPPFNL